MQQRGDRVRDRRAHAAEDLVARHVDTRDLQMVAERRHVARLHLDEEHGLVRRQMVGVTCLAELSFVFLGQPAVGPVGDDAYRSWSLPP